MLPGSCIYHPTCSNYAKDAVHTHGIFRGFLLGTARLLRCLGVLFEGGEDPVPEEFSFSDIPGGYRRFWRGRGNKQ